MATRLYPTQALPDFTVHGPYRSVYSTFGFDGAGFGPVLNSYRAKDSKTDGGELFNLSLKTNQESNYDGILRRWYSDRLDAQTISGTFDMAMQWCQRWQTGAGGANSSVVHIKIHVFITVGDSTVVRHTLLNNYVESTNVVPFDANLTTRTAIQLTGPPALTSGDAQAGDRLCIEVLVRVVSSPTPAPTYVPTTFTEISWRGWGTTNSSNVPLATDMVAGNTATNLAPWFEFSDTITFQALPSPPVNDACADAIDLTATIPFIVSDVNTITSAGLDRAIWYKFTAPETGKFCIMFHGTNYNVSCNIRTGICSALVPVASERKSVAYSRHRSQTTVMWDAVSGTEYFIEIYNETSLAETAENSGGIFGMKGFYRSTTPQPGDLYLPSGNVTAFRDGEPVNFTSAFVSSQPTGVAIDYTRDTMDDLNGGTNSNERLLIGLHNFEIVEILNLPDLSYGEGQFEVDFINDPWNVIGVSIHPAQLYITEAGLLIAAWFGNGYLYVSGAGTLPAFLNTVSDNADYPKIKTIPAKNGDNQSGAPFTDTLYAPTIEITAPWAIDVLNGILYYTSGGLYVPVGGDEVRRFNLNTSVQGAVFCNPALVGTDNPGLKGLAVLATGGVLLCNGTVVQKYDSSGNLTGTYTPSIAMDSTTLVDVVLDPDGAHAYVIDLFSTRVFKFLISNMTEVSSFQSYSHTGAVLQMAVYASPENPYSGIYVLEVDKRNDTLYASLSPETTEDRKIPDPTYKTALLGE